MKSITLNSVDANGVGTYPYLDFNEETKSVFFDDKPLILTINFYCVETESIVETREVLVKDIEFDDWGTARISTPSRYYYWFMQSGYQCNDCIDVSERNGEYTICYYSYESGDTTTDTLNTTVTVLVHDNDRYYLGGYDVNGYGRDGYDIDGYDIYGYDRDGYNRSGYDRDGYNENGFDNNGYDKSGYDRYGYDRSGYDRDGYDRYGYNRDGYDISGYDRDGYDKYGYNIDGYDRSGYDRDGYDKSGYNIDGFDKDGHYKYGDFIPLANYYSYYSEYNNVFYSPVDNYLYYRYDNSGTYEYQRLSKEDMDTIGFRDYDSSYKVYL